MGLLQPLCAGKGNHCAIVGTEFQWWIKYLKTFALGLQVERAGGGHAHRPVIVKGWHRLRDTVLLPLASRALF